MAEAKSTDVLASSAGGGAGGASAAQAVEGKVQELAVHRGSCHCGRVSFEMTAPRRLIMWDCNCSICLLKRNTHIVVPRARFRLIAGEEFLSEYRFNTRVARHLFCSVCGVQAFYQPRSNPDGYGITLSCLGVDNIDDVTVKHFDGSDWEGYLERSGIQSLSKAPASDAVSQSIIAAKESPVLPESWEEERPADALAAFAAPMVVHRGGCHCGAVRFAAAAPKDLLAWKCNCTRCRITRPDAVLLPSAQFLVTRGDDKLASYTFGEGGAIHRFCTICGVETHCERHRAGRAMAAASELVALSLPCLDSSTLHTATAEQRATRATTIRRDFDGKRATDEDYAAMGVAACAAARVAED